MKKQRKQYTPEEKVAGLWFPERECSGGFTQDRQPPYLGRVRTLL
jgi:hypothetical protein